MEASLKQLLQRLDNVASRLEAVEQKIGGGGGSAGAAAPAAGTAGESGARFVQDFDTLVAETVKPFVEQTQKIGNAELKKQVALFEKAVGEQRKFLNVAAQAKKPSDAEVVELLKPTQALVDEVIAIRDSNRGNAQFNWLSTVSEGIPALGWVTVSPTPGPYVHEFRGNAQFYSNKLLREFRGKDENQTKWVNYFTQFTTGLMDYIKKYHTTGLSWNPNGGDAKTLFGSTASAGPAGGPPPPPAAPKQPLTSTPSAKPSSNAAAALFAEINKGAAISSGLKKVTKDMKTKYRPASEKSSVVPATTAKKPAPARKWGGATGKSQPPKFALEGNKWVVEFQDGNKNIVIENPEAKHVVYLYRCNNSVVKINSKVNAITIDECKRTGIVFTDAIATCEVVNSNSVEIQCTGKVPNFAIDKTSGVQLYLGKSGLGCEIVTSKSDQMNVLIPKGDDMEELAVPEQFKTVIKDGKLVTTHVEHA